MLSLDSGVTFWYNANFNRRKNCFTADWGKVLIDSRDLIFGFLVLLMLSVPCSANSVAPLVGVLEDAEISSCCVDGGCVFGRGFVGGVVGDNDGGLISAGTNFVNM